MLWASVWIFVVGCSNKSVTMQLAQIDELLLQDKVDSAFNSFSKVSPAELRTEADTAYYYLLQTEINYRKWIPEKSDDAISYSVDYYKKTNDSEKLARAYFYKGETTYTIDSLPRTIHLLKLAEAHANKTNNLLLKHKIYESLSYYNGEAFEIERHKNYAMKALEIARILNDKERQVIAMQYLTTSYFELGDIDSAKFYATECMPLLQTVDSGNWAYQYTNLGIIYEKEDPLLAKAYLKKALAIKGKPYTYKTLADIYLKEDSTDKAREMWEMALERTRNSKMNPMRIEIFSTMRQQCAERKDYRQANALADSAMAWQKRYYETQEQERLAEIQAKYDKELAEQQLWHKIYGWGLVLIVIVGLVIAWLGYNSYRGLKAKKALAETRAQLAAYTLKAEELEAGKEVNVKEVARLHQKISELQQRQAGILANGRQLWEALQAGATAFNWNKGDFTDFVEYYKLKDLPFVNELETDYERLSVKYMTFAILEHEGLSDADIQRIMGISESTLRSTRSRINKARRA